MLGVRVFHFSSFPVCHQACLCTSHTQLQQHSAMALCRQIFRPYTSPSSLPFLLESCLESSALCCSTAVRCRDNTTLASPTTANAATAITARFGNEALEGRAAPAAGSGNEDVLAKRMHSTVFAFYLSHAQKIG